MQHITMPTVRNTQIIYRLITNLPENKVITSNVLSCPTVSDHDETYIIVKISGKKFETREKSIRNMKRVFSKTLNMKFFLVYITEDPNEQLETF